MNPISFAKAPLIEIIAELKWLPTGLPVQQPGPQQIIFSGTGNDGFLISFARQSDVKRFTNAERVVPEGFPTPWSQVVWRFRDPDNPAVLLQIGPGVFTANALQPYRHWTEFRPTVEAGVRALLASRPEKERQQPLIGVTLRYINGFSSDLLAGKPVNQFIRDVLGFKIEPPDHLAQLYSSRYEGSTSANLLIPIANKSKTFSVQVGDGAIQPVGSTEQSIAVLLDMTVAEAKAVEPVFATIMECLDSSRELIHDAFVNITKTIHDRMIPLHGSDQ